MTHSLNLSNIALHLEGLEETIIMRLVDRAQWCVNSRIYQVGSSGFHGEPERSLFEIRLRYQEEMDARFGRFCVPEERPFTAALPQPQRDVVLPDTGLKISDYEKVNLTDIILKKYLELLERICPAGDDQQYGSSVEHDVYAVQAISRRIHYGALYVAECKFSEDPQGYGVLIGSGDRNSLLTRLTRKEVEDRIIARVEEKVHSVQANVNLDVRNTIDPVEIRRFYHDVIIPLTKEGEILYLLNRVTD